MIYRNPVIRGFYPDPSVCEYNGKYYLAASSFQYFPGVPLFESEDLINWEQIGHVLTRNSQVMLDKVRSSGGVFAPTLRCHNGRFYMVTNNNSTNENFYVYTDDIYGEWSEPVVVDQEGIDPSLFFDENGEAFFISNGTGSDGKPGVFQCKINIDTGERLTDSVRIWCGSGGRYLESPHMYKIGDYYYLMAAEGGTEYGHMVTLSRAKDIWGGFENCPFNPVLTNRNRAPYLIQGIGHGDLIKRDDGQWFIVTLGFRQIDLWEPYHTLGREVYLTPVTFIDNGSDKNWFKCGCGETEGTTDECYEIAGDTVQKRKNVFTFDNTSWNIEWAYLRQHHPEKYKLTDVAELIGTEITLEDVDSPTFIAMRQIDFDMKLCCRLHAEFDAADSCIPEAGITIYMCEKEHYDIALRKKDDGIYASLKLNIGDIKHVENEIRISDSTETADAILEVESDSLEYRFYVEVTEKTAGKTGSEKSDEDYERIYLGKGRSKYLSSEVSSGFTGVMTGLYAIGNVTACFEDYKCLYD